MSLTKEDLDSISALIEKSRLSSEGRMLNAITSSKKSLIDRIDNRFNELNARFNEVDNRFSEVDSKFDEVYAKFDRLKNDIKQVQIATLENFEVIESNNRSIQYLSNKVDLLNQNITARFAINEEKILQVEMQTKKQ